MSKLRDLATFSQAQLDTQDVDPAYPILRDFESGMTSDEAIWHTFLYVAYYNLPSSYLAYHEWPTVRYWLKEPRKPEHWKILCLPTGIERRGLRGGANMEDHLTSLATCWAAANGSFNAWLRKGFGDDPKANWHQLQENLQLPRFNGRWAAYKTGEILMKVHDFPVEPTDMGMAFSSGPRWGLGLFFDGDLLGNDPVTIKKLDRRARMLKAHLAFQFGVRMGIEQLETMLCDFHSLCEGRYYSGHDIDQIQEQLLLAEKATGETFNALWKARERTLPRNTLGEFNGWQGVDTARKQVYKRTGKVVTR